METTYDVAIIGGGPAGSTAATFLARQGRRVIVLEREKFPRFHIGESLLPYSMGAFDRLGVREKMDASFVPKHGGLIATTCGTRSVKFYFKDGFRLKHRQAYQVRRADFDKMLLDNAAENGAVVHEQTTVEHVAFSDDAVTLKLKPNEATRANEIKARYVVDCSGRNTVIGSFFKLKQSYAHLQKFSVYAHFDGVTRDEGIDGSLIRLIRGEGFWFWMIPVSETRTSVGLVMDVADFKKQKRSPEDMLEMTIRVQPVMWERMQNAERVTPVYSAGDYSYRNSSLVGDRWLLAGDAAGFIDPIFSTGVFLAIRSGEQAADAIDLALRKPNEQRRAFKKYETSVKRVMNMYLRFVTAWYEPQFIQVITHPVTRFQLTAAINAVLAGNIGTSFSLWWRMQIFYTVVFLQRYLPLCPRLSLAPQPSEESLTAV